MKRLALFIFLFLLTPQAFATSIVILVTPQYILLGVDSKRISLDSRFQVTANSSVCKIRQVNQYCFVMAGYVASAFTRFSADSIVAHHLLHTDSYEQAVAAIKEDIISALKNDISYRKQYHPQSFKKFSASKEHLLEIALLYLNDGRPQVQIIGFRMTDEEHITVLSYSTACPGDCPQQQPQVYFLGEYAGMEHFLSKTTSMPDPVLFVEELISIQAAATPTSVGLPVNMIKYSARGVEWIR